MSIDNNFISVSNRLLPKEPMQFFGISTNNTKRIFVTIADDPAIWQKDLVIGERIFGNTIICPYKDYTNHTIAWNNTRNILKDRMKYPGVKENPDFLAIAKTWILPDQLIMGPDANEFFKTEDGPKILLEPTFNKLNIAPSINYLKIEVGHGMERLLTYSILDAGFRPGLICIKWSYTPDEHTPTAHCVGHLLNSGYSLVKVENNYSLYHYNDDVIYDMCGVEEISMQNPFVKTICNSLAVKIQEDVMMALQESHPRPQENIVEVATENTETKIDEGSSGSVN
jgi:hypothetical protein